MCGVCVHVVRVCAQCVCPRPEEDIGYPVLSLCTLFPGDSASHWPEAACSAVLLGGLAKKFLPSPSLPPTTLELQEHTGMTCFYMGARDSNTGPQVYTESTLTY